MLFFGRLWYVSSPFCAGAGYLILAASLHLLANPHSPDIIQSAKPQKAMITIAKVSMIFQTSLLIVYNLYVKLADRSVAKEKSTA
jgi:hypothetical protein